MLFLRYDDCKYKMYFLEKSCAAVFEVKHTVHELKIFCWSSTETYDVGTDWVCSQEKEIESDGAKSG